VGATTRPAGRDGRPRSRKLLWWTIVAVVVLALVSTAAVVVALRLDREAELPPGIPPQPAAISLDPQIDPVAATVTVRGEAVHLTPLEFRLLHTLARHPGEVIGRDRLLELVWGTDRAAPEQVKLYVGYLRRKLESVLPAEEIPIETVRGFGYRYLSPAGDQQLA